MHVLPPISIDVLTANPEFAKLHEFLVKHKLNQGDYLSPVPRSTAHVSLSDGTNTRDSSTRTPQEVYSDLQQARIQNARRDLLVQFLRSVADAKVQGTDHASEYERNHLDKVQTGTSATHPEPTLSALPSDVQASINIISKYLQLAHSHQNAITFPPDTADLLADDTSTFRSHLPDICQALSKQIVQTENILARLAATALPNSTQPTSATTPPLCETLDSAERTYRDTLRDTLPSLLRDTTAELDTLLKEHAAGLVRAIRTLERTTHGTDARHTLAKTGLLGAVAEGIECKARIMRLQGLRDLLGDERCVARMQEMQEGLGREEADLERHERELEGLLGEYEREGGEGVFAQLGEKYVDVEGEIGDVKRDIEMLEEKIRGARKRGR